MDLFNDINLGAYYFFSFQNHNRPILSAAMQVGAWLGSLPVLAAISLLGLYLLRRDRHACTAALVALTAALVLVEGCRAAIARPRPIEAQRFVGASEMNKGYPARSALLSIVAWSVFGVGVVRRLHVRRWLVIALTTFVLLWVSMSQLFLTLHYLTDLLAGVAGGLGILLLFCWYVRRWRGLPQSG